MEESTLIAIKDDEIICNCFQVTERTIRSHIEKNNVTQVENVTSTCEAGGNCGSCHILIQLFIDQNKHKKALGKTDPFENANSDNHKKGFWKKFFTNS